MLCVLPWPDSSIGVLSSFHPYPTSPLSPSVVLPLRSGSPLIDATSPPPSHFEIHPLLMFGAVAAALPLSHHNGVSRTTAAAAMFKQVSSAAGRWWLG